MGSPNKRVLQTSTETVGNISGGGCMHGDIVENRKSKIIKNKIKSKVVRC